MDFLFEVGNTSLSSLLAITASRLLDREDEVSQKAALWLIDLYRSVDVFSVAATRHYVRRS